jgi:hypothetical protein
MKGFLNLSPEPPELPQRQPWRCFEDERNHSAVLEQREGRRQRIATHAGTALQGTTNTCAQRFIVIPDDEHFDIALSFELDGTKGGAPGAAVQCL